MPEDRDPNRAEDDGGRVPPGRDPALWDLAARYWSGALAADPLSATLLGVHDHDDRLPDPGRAADAARAELLSAQARELAGLRDGALGDADAVTAALLGHQISSELEWIDLGLGDLASDQMTGPHAELLMVAAQLGYPTARSAEAALSRAAAVPTMLTTAAERFAAAAAEGRTPAAAALERSLSTLAAYLASDADDDPLLAATLDPEVVDVDEWRRRMRAVVVDEVRPAMAAYREALARDLGPAARDDEHPGWCWLPDGDALYAAAVRRHTTVDRSPAELHDLGRELCEERLPREFAEVGAEAFGSADAAEVVRRLREDPSLRHRDAEEIVRVARTSVERATAAMGGWFGRLPESPCRVEPVPGFLAADAPYAYYFPPAPDGSRPGTYFINTADPEGSSATEAESIAFHEAIPGHHLQLAIAQELDSLPEFQRHDGATSYIEGWGLYAERLADEMGLYSGPLDRLGMLTADAWRSARLVVDTGLHALGWSRDRAIAYFVDHTPVPVDQVATEVDRYIAMPGQALAYKVGQVEIERLRARAEETLGAGFTPGVFHDVVLGSGAVTLPVLADQVESWLRRSAAGGR